MIVTVEEAKVYLRVDNDDEDNLIETLIKSAQNICMEVARIKDEVEYESAGEMSKAAILYALSYLYENRGEINKNELTLTLRSLLFGIREEMF